MSLRIGVSSTSPELSSSLLDTRYRQEIKDPVFPRRNWRWDHMDKPWALGTTAPFEPGELDALRGVSADVTKAARKAARDFFAHQTGRVAGLSILSPAPALAPTERIPLRYEEPTVYAEAVRELEQVRKHAIEDGWPEPNDLAVDNARRLLDHMHEHFPQQYYVYPSHNGGVCLQPPGGDEWSFLVICEPDGKLLCSADRPKRPWQVRFPSFDRALGSGLILKALHDDCLDISVP